MYSKGKIKKLFACNPLIFGLLKESETIEEARTTLFSYLHDRIKYINVNWEKVESLEFALRNQCLTTFRKMLTVRSEGIVKFSLIELLWKLAHDDLEGLPADLNDGFFEEMNHFFNGLRGKAGIYDEAPYPKFANLSGRRASVLRSDRLDEMAEECLEKMEKFPLGISEEFVIEREKNKKRILNYFNATEEDWLDYKWQLKHVIKDEQKLGKLVKLTAAEKQAIQLANQYKIPFGITPYYVSLMDFKPHRKLDHAVRAQVIPPLSYVKEMISYRDVKEHSFDFMLEQNTSPVKLITRRYPMIVIFKPYNTCSQICVYCQRNWEITHVASSRAMASKETIEAAFKWIEEHKAIKEVLVTGGDPLVMNDEKLEMILNRLSNISHVERIRIGTRTPVVLPQRITESLLAILRRYNNLGKCGISLITHFEHPYEITPQARDAVEKILKQGIPVYNQAVFTVENSRRFEMVALRRALKLIGIDPYYTFNTKGKKETSCYRVPMARLRQELKEEARLIPGLMRTDEPVYNVPGLGKNYLRALQNHSLLTIRPDGRRVYEFHPWEKYLSLVDTFIDVDVSIYDYLKELARRGENIEDYSTIWYYY